MAKQLAVDIKDYKILKRDYNKALNNGVIEFTFMGKPILTSYAKYLLQFLKQKFGELTPTYIVTYTVGDSDKKIKLEVETAFPERAEELVREELKKAYGKQLYRLIKIISTEKVKTEVIE